MEGIEGYDPIENLATGLQTITNERIHVDRAVIQRRPGNQNASSDKGHEIPVQQRKSKLSRKYHREKRNEANQTLSKVFYLELTCSNLKVFRNRRMCTNLKQKSE